MGNRIFNLIDGDDGSTLNTQGPVGYGGYGGLIDGKGVIWSTNSGLLLRWDTAGPLSGLNGGTWDGYNYNGTEYGLGIDPAGNVWMTTYGAGVIYKIDLNGTPLGTYSQGNSHAQGCAADTNGDVWVAHSLGYSSIGHLLNDGTYVGTIPLGSPSGPTGIAVDANGKIWATGYSSGKVYRIDPALGPVGGGGVNVGDVDLVVDLKLPSEINPPQLYNYSDMTGSTLFGAPESGTWTVVYDSTCSGIEWGTVSWTADTPDDSSITVTAASSEDGVTFSSPAEIVSDGVDLTVANGRYLKVVVTFQRSSGGDSPILYDLTIGYLGDCNGPGPGPIEVGGTIQPVNKLMLLTPWIALGILLAAWTTIIIRRRSTQS